jgi:hypothetical protein
MMGKLKQLAVEAGISALSPELRRFAALVAYSERRACVDKLHHLGVPANLEDLDEWCETVLWCCSMLNNPSARDVTFCPDYTQIDREKARAARAKATEAE